MCMCMYAGLFQWYRVSSVPPSSSTPAVPSSSTPSLKSLYDNLALPNRFWCDQTANPLTDIKLCKLYSRASSSNTHCLTVHEDLQWSLFIHGHKLDHSSCSALASIPVQLTPASFSPPH